MNDVAPVKIKDIKNIKQIACGLDHIVMLDKSGSIKSMGDDTFGQCGVENTGSARASAAPFFEVRHGAPQHVQIPHDSEGKPQPVTKIVCGFRHTLAITENGKLYGWGYNNQQQLSHSQEYADEATPMHAIFTPQRIAGPLDGMCVVDAAAGEEMSIVVAHGKTAGIIYE
jgi:alpha-tubulin suppressor-like RCC1 family protein